MKVRSDGLGKTEMTFELNSVAKEAKFIWMA